MVRRTLRMSKLGRELWLACRPDDAAAPQTQTHASVRTAIGNGRAGYDGTSGNRAPRSP